MSWLLKMVLRYQIEVTFVKNNAEEHLEYHFKLNYWESIDPDEDLYTMNKDPLESFSPRF